MLRYILMPFVVAVIAWPSSAVACSCFPFIEVHWPPTGELLNVDSGLIVSHHGALGPPIGSAPMPLFLRDASGADVAFTPTAFPALNDCASSRYILVPDAPLTDGAEYSVGLIGAEPGMEGFDTEVTFTASASAGGDEAPSSMDVHYTQVTHPEIAGNSCYIRTLPGTHSLSAVLRIDPVGAGATVVASATNTQPDLSSFVLTDVGDSQLVLTVPLTAADDCVTVTLFDAQGIAGATATVCEPDDCVTHSEGPDFISLPNEMGPAGPCGAGPEEDPEPTPEEGPEPTPEEAPDAQTPAPPDAGTPSDSDGCASAGPGTGTVGLALLLAFLLLVRRRRATSAPLLVRRTSRRSLARLLAILLVAVGSLPLTTSAAQACSCYSILNVAWPQQGEVLHVNSGIIVSHTGGTPTPTSPTGLFLRDSQGQDVPFDTVSFPSQEACQPSRHVVLPDAPLTNGEEYTIGLIGEQSVEGFETEATFTASSSSGGAPAATSMDIHYTQVTHPEVTGGDCYLNAMTTSHSLSAILEIQPMGPTAAVLASATNAHPDLSVFTLTDAGASLMTLVVPVKTPNDCITVTFYDAQGQVSATSTVCEPDDCATNGEGPDYVWLPNEVGNTGPCGAAPEPGPEPVPDAAPEADATGPEPAAEPVPDAAPEPDTTAADAGPTMPDTSAPDASGPDTSTTPDPTPTAPASENDDDSGCQSGTNGPGTLWLSVMVALAALLARRLRLVPLGRGE